jgi:predicted ATPase
MRFRFADCVLDADRFTLTKGGEPVPVQPKVLDLLLALLRAQGRTLTKQELLDTVWPGTATGESSLTRAISFARTALGESERDARVICTVRGRGYRVGVPVHVESEEPKAAPPSTGDFVCRDRELALARDVLHEALAGRGQLLLLVGEPGIGKTRLAIELGRIARTRGALVFWGRCHEAEAERAYGPWLQILRAALAEWGADAVQEEIGEGAATELASLLPGLRELLPELPQPLADAKQAQRVLFDGLERLLRRRAARQPLLLVFDDLHCADEASLELLRLLGHVLAELPVLLVGSYRDLEVGERQPLAAALLDLARAHPPRRQLFLRGLEPSCVRRFVARRLGVEPSPGLVSVLHARTEGNPLFLLELLFWLESRGGASAEPPDGFEHEVPEGVRQVIRQRLATLSEPCRAALAAAAVIGREFPAHVLERTLDCTGEESSARLTEAETARVLEPVRGTPGRFRFTHTLLRETLYEDLPSLARARLHLRAGEALEARYRPQPLVPTRQPLPIPGAHLAELAHHFAAALPAGDAARALAYSEGAGAHALSLLAFAEAERHFERALLVLDAERPSDESTRARLLAARARAAAGAEAG